MEYIVKGLDVLVYEKDFNLDQTLDCGQAFRWSKTETGFKGFFYNRFLELEEKDGAIIFKNTSQDDFLEIWKDYFDFDKDYDKLKKIFFKDDTLKKACEYAYGIRLLKQNSWETLCSFIISQNNNIPRIKGIINRLCEKFGCFPDEKKLAICKVEDLEFLKAGFRTKYILDAAKKVASCEIDLSKIKSSDINFGRKELLKIYGVGPKVAECTLLFGMYQTEAFPIDVWIKKALDIYYPLGFPAFVIEKGIAQQYLFHYIRNNNEI